MAAALLCAPASALGQTEGDYLYRVTVLRAASGHFTDLLGTLEESFGLDQKAGDEIASWMRHSQGDQWDFVLIYPMGDFSSYYDATRTTRRATV